MNQSEDVEVIKKHLLNTLNEMGVVVKSIILFGSRAKGEFSKSSDYDFLIIVNKTYDFKEKMKIRKKLNQTLAKLLIPSDIIINSEEEIEYKKNRIGCITRYALKEGIKLW